jgi:hypothetical protein
MGKRISSDERRTFDQFISDETYKDDVYGNIKKEAFRQYFLNLVKTWCYESLPIPSEDGLVEDTQEEIANARELREFIQRKLGDE